MIYNLIKDAKRAQLWLYFSIISVLLNLIIVIFIPKQIIINYILFIIIILNIIFIIYQTMKTYKIFKRIVKEKLLPYKIITVNGNWKISAENFKIEETVNSLFIEEGGSFIPNIKIIDNKTYFSHIINFISISDTDRIIFKGTFIKCFLPHKFEGAIQIRQKGKPSKDQRTNQRLRRIKNEFTRNYPKIHFYSQNDVVFISMISNELVELYLKLLLVFNKKIYLTINHNELYLGINNGINFFEYSIFKPLNIELITKKINYLKKIDEALYLINTYINKTS